MGGNLVNTEGADRKFNTRLVLLLVVVCLGLTVLGLRWWAGYRESITDRSLFTGLPCAPPCWQGIVPGETTAEEAMQILRASPYVKQDNIEKTGTYALGALRAYWKASPGGVVVSLRDNQVRRVTFNTPYRLTLGEVVEELGPPEALTAGIAGVPEHPWWGISIYYPSIGTLLGVEGEDVNDPYLEPSMRIKAITFVASHSSLKGLLTELFETDGNEYLEHSRPWKGFGRLFEIYYDSPQDAMW